MVKEVIKLRGCAKVFDGRWRLLPRFPGLRRFDLGIYDLKFLKGFEYRSISLCLPFVLDGLFDTPLALSASVAYVRWRQQLALISYTGKDLQSLRNYGVQLQEAMNELHRTVTCNDSEIIGTVKFHKIGHWPDFVLSFGIPDNYNGETFETMHKLVVKRWIGKIRLTKCPTKVIHRDRVAELHREQQAPTKAQRRDGDVRGFSGGWTNYDNVTYQVVSKVFSAVCGVWISAGTSILCTIENETCKVKIECILTTGSTAFLRVRKYLPACPTRSRNLDLIATPVKLNTTVALLRWTDIQIISIIFVIQSFIDPNILYISYCTDIL
jgi:hypothetical protein